MSKSLFLLSTPSQAFFLSHTPHLVKDSFLVITIKKEEEAKKILHNIGHLNWKKIEIWYTVKKRNEPEALHLLKLRLRILWFKMRNRKFEKVFIGSYVNIVHLSLLAEYEKNSKTFLLYDGLQMISTNLLRNKSKGKYVKKYPKPYEKLYFKKPTIHSLTYVSPLDLKVQGEDSLFLIKNTTVSEGKEKKDKVIFFIGQPLSGIGLITEEFYLESLQKFKRRFPDYTIFYFPHPREEDHMLASIRDIFEVKVNNVVFEEYFLALPNPPGTVASFYSSVLTNLIFFKTGSKIISLEIPPEEINRYKSKIASVYKYFHAMENEDFKVFNLEEM